MRALVRGGRGSVRARLRFLWNDMPTEGVELLSAFLSATFAVLLFKTGSEANAIQHAYWFAALCTISASLKLLGVVLEYTTLRVLGLLLGTIFWVTLAGVFLSTVRGSITWLCFAVLAAAQIWGVWRVMWGRWR